MLSSFIELVSPEPSASAASSGVAGVVGDEDLDESTIAIHEAWRAGELSWKLDPHQLRVYHQYRQWESETTSVAFRTDTQLEITIVSKRGQMARVFVMDISRRWGKTSLCLVIKFEDCLRRPRSLHTYATAYAKDIAEIILPLVDELFDDAPDDITFRFQSSKQGRSMGIFFSNGSVLKLVGIDLHPRSLRGRGSDGMVISEAGHVKKLGRTVRNVIYPQFQRRPHAKLILESNAPEDPEHDFDKVFVPDAIDRTRITKDELGNACYSGAYVFKSIDDNEGIDAIEKAEFIEAAGGRGAATCEREYYGVRVREETRVLVPEFDAERHVRRSRVPKFARAIVSADPGSQDLFALLFGYWDFARAKLVIQYSWAEQNAGTGKVAEVIAKAEAKLWGGKSDANAIGQRKAKERGRDPEAEEQARRERIAEQAAQIRQAAREPLADDQASTESDAGSVANSKHEDARTLCGTSTDWVRRVTGDPDIDDVVGAMGPDVPSDESDRMRGMDSADIAELERIDRLLEEIAGDDEEEEQEQEQTWLDDLGALVYWDSDRFAANPATRTTDIALQMIVDMNLDHGIRFNLAKKDDAEAQLHAIREAFRRNKIEIWPNSGPLESQLNAGTWNEKRTDWSRTEGHGHFDCIAALIYMWRALAQFKRINPAPLEIPEGGADNVFIPPDMKKRGSHTVKAMNAVLGGKSVKGRRKSRGVRAMI